MAITRLGGANAITGTLPAANINDTSIGNITALPAGVGGKVLQVVSAKKTSIFNTTSTSFVDVGLEATITPSATSSKISVYLDTGGMGRAAIANECPRVKILRAGSDNYGGGNIFFSSDSFNYSGVSTSFHYIDEPSSTSALLYKVQMETRSGNDCDFNSGGSSQFASIILMEVSG